MTDKRREQKNFAISSRDEKVQISTASQEIEPLSRKEKVSFKVKRRETVSKATASEGLTLLKKSRFVYVQNSITTSRQTRSRSGPCCFDNARNTSLNKTINEQNTFRATKEESNNEVRISNKNIFKPKENIRQISIKFLTDQSFDECKLLEALSFFDLTTHHSVEEIINIIFESCGEDRGLSSEFGKILFNVSQIIESKQLHEIDFPHLLGNKCQAEARLSPFGLVSEETQESDNKNELRRNGVIRLIAEIYNLNLMS